jgi:hypothetical protein
MKRLLTALLWLAVLVGVAFPQNGTQHGVLVSWTASASTVQGYYVFRCPGSCTVSSTGWVNVTSGLVTGTNYLDPSSGLTVNTSYSYAALAVDANGNQSSFSNVATVTIPSAFPTNPGPPLGCNAKVQ